MFAEDEESRAGILLFGPVRQGQSGKKQITDGTDVTFLLPDGSRDVRYGRINLTPGLISRFERGNSSFVLCDVP